jgi:hypothetical protein
VGFENVTVSDWGSRTRRPRRALCQNDDPRAPSTPRAELPLAVLEALTVHRCGLSTAAYGIHAALVGISMCMVVFIAPDIAGGMAAVAEPAPPQMASALAPVTAIKSRATRRRSVKPRCTTIPTTSVSGNFRVARYTGN